MLIEKERKLLKNNYPDVAKKCVCIRLIFPGQTNCMSNFRPAPDRILNVTGNFKPACNTTVITGRVSRLFSRNSF